MKRGIAAALVMMMLTGIGCITTAPPDTTKVTERKIVPIPPPPAPVTADRITSANGHAIAQNLSDELDYEARQSATPAP